MAVKFAIFTFTNKKFSISKHLQVGNMTALFYLIKRGCSHKNHLLDISKRILQYLLSEQITITVEYIPIKLNMEADWESRNVEAKAEWKLLLFFFFFLQNIKGTGKTESGLVCIKSVPSVSSVYGMET